MILDRQYLEEIYRTDLSTIKRIDLSNKQITEIKSGTFTDLPALKIIDLSNNQITEINSGTFTNLPTLQSVNLSNNYITTIQPETFSNLSELQFIYLANNQITTIKSRTFTNLLKLIEINLSNNQITNIEQGAFSNLSKLNRINLSNNYIAIIETEAFTNLQNLRNIDLSNNLILNISNILIDAQILLINNKRINTDFLNKLNPEYISYYSISSIYDIISSYNNLKELQKLYPKPNQIFLLFNTNGDEQPIIKISKRDQLLVDAGPLSPSLLNTAEEYEQYIKNIAKRVQLLADIVYLKELPITEKELLNINKKSIKELEESMIELKTISNIKHTSTITKPELQNIPKDTKDIIKSYLGGSNDKIYKDKYLKYKNKYLELKKSLK